MLQPGLRCAAGNILSAWLFRRFVPMESRLDDILKLRGHRLLDDAPNAALELPNEPRLSVTAAILPGNVTTTMLVDATDRYTRPMRMLTAERSRWHV